MAFAAVRGSRPLWDRSISAEVIVQLALLKTYTRRYTVAIAREVPDSLAHGLANHVSNATPPVDISRAKNQHENYVNKLRSIVPTLVLPSLPDHPDCVFVEDAAVAAGRIAVINRLGHVSRLGEVDDIKKVLQQFGLKVTDMREVSEDATCDGGDVLFVAGHVFVGLSDRTNQEGVEVIRRVFEPSGVKVVQVPRVTDDALHLKSVVTCLDQTTLVAPAGELGEEIISAMGVNRIPDVTRTILLRSVPQCNILSINGHVIAQATTCTETRRILEEETTKQGYQLAFLDTSEFAKVDGGLTCKSIILNI